MAPDNAASVVACARALSAETLRSAPHARAPGEKTQRRPRARAHVTLRKCRAGTAAGSKSSIKSRALSQARPRELVGKLPRRNAAGHRGGRPRARRGSLRPGRCSASPARGPGRCAASRSRSGPQIAVVGAPPRRTRDRSKAACPSRWSQPSQPLPYVAYQLPLHSFYSLQSIEEEEVGTVGTALFCKGFFPFRGWGQVGSRLELWPSRAPFSRSAITGPNHQLT